MIYDLSGKRVFVAGHRGMVGGALLRRLQRERCDLLTVGRERLDLLDQAAVRSFMFEARPDAVIIAAAKVGGIQANSTYPAEFLYENLAIETNVIHSAFRAGVEKLVFLGSSCIYPKFAPQPIREDALLSGPLEPTNDCYAVAKIAGLKLCEAYRSQYGAGFISVMLTNLYGPGDSFHLDTSHVIPALLRKAHEAKLSGAATVSIWGSGTPRREFLYVDDAADAIVHLLTTYSGAQHVNIGSGEDITILELMKLICRVVGFEGKIVTDPSKPDGTPRKLLDVSRLSASGWRPRKRLKEGLAETYAWYLQNVEGMLQRA
ncbi:GDP-L-fucose synthase [Hyphomicrobium sp.]|uniref:GDP-L-fucose synthase n=1 Tax=Hyphomicrobium sp. TaxID=82 RepID=UPI0025B879D3|nr:GDP-L-fucose synthase [Hyphomicrobium sp.]